MSQELSIFLLVYLSGGICLFLFMIILLFYMKDNTLSSKMIPVCIRCRGVCKIESHKMIEMEDIKDKITDLKQAIKLYEDNGI